MGLLSKINVRKNYISKTEYKLKRICIHVNGELYNYTKYVIRNSKIYVD